MAATPAVYTDAASVAVALRLAPDTTLQGGVATGATSLTLASVQTPAGIPFYPGMYLALDQYNPSLREVVQISDAITGTGPYTVPVTACANAHTNGVPVKEVSGLQDVIGAASRLWDAATYTAPGAFAAQSWAETLMGQGTPDGRLFVQVSGRNVTAVSALAWATQPDGTQVPLSTANVTWADYQVWGWPGSVNQTADAPAGLTPSPFAKQAVVFITYTAGYDPMPTDIQRFCTVMAARLWKEAESGYSDVLATGEMGLLQYKKGIPSDMALLVKPWRRWS